MFLLDPTEGLSREELLQHMWHVQMTPPQRAKILEKSEARGCTWQDLIRETFEQYDTMIEDPIQCEEWLQTHEEMERRKATPFGPDPLLEQDGAS